MTLHRVCRWLILLPFLLLAGCTSTSAAPAFRDIYLGANAVTPVHPGYDMITGLGSPNIANLVKDLLVARSVGR